VDIINYRQAFFKMPESMRHHFEKQTWLPTSQQGGDYAELLSSREAMARLHLVLSERECWILKLIVRRLGCSMFTLEMLEKHAAPVRSGAEVKVALAGIRKYGVILTFRKSWGELLFALPFEGFTIWQKLLLEEPDHKSGDQVPLLAAIEGISAESRGIAQDLFALVTYAAFHDLQLTAKGNLPKNLLQKLKVRLHLPDIPWNLTSLADIKSGSPEFGLELLLDFALRLGLLHKNADYLVVDTDNWRQWLQYTFEQQQSKLYILWKDLHNAAPLWLQHGMALIEGLPNERWCTLKEISHWYDRHVALESAWSFEEHEEDLLRQWILPLHAFRWLETGVDEQGVVWFHWLVDHRLSVQALEPERRADADAFYVQPDFELLLPPTVSSHAEWEVAMFADPVSSTDMRIYRITRETFYRGLESGKSGQEIVQFLASHATSKIPSGLEQILMEWDKQFGKLQFVEVTLLRVSTPEIAEAIHSSVSCHPYILSRIGEVDFIVKKEQSSQFHKHLQQMGYHPQLPNPPKMSSVVPSAPETGQRIGWCSIELSIPGYDLAPSFADMDPMYPHLQEIPPLWLKEFREYHGSTRKDMIRKAIEWKSYLKLRKEGVERQIMPQSLREDSNGWMLLGMENAQDILLRSEDWKEMKLILPGINDP
jgi:hypothetical protein